MADAYIPRRAQNAARHLPPDQWTRQDAEANEAKRLGAEKQVKLCSLMLVEVSPPATNHTLIESYRRLPFLSAADVRRVSRELTLQP